MRHETERLILQRPRLSDASALLRIFGDAEAMRYTLHFPAMRNLRRHIAGHERQRRRLGYGPWTVLERTSRQTIGFGGLYEDPFEPGWGPELAYHFAPEHWGRGYASELAAYCLAFAHGPLGIASLGAFTHPDNAASRRVLEKAGFRRQCFIVGMNRHFYVHEVASGRAE